jgi:membrane fusion protein, multidrug efflux system
MNLHSKRGDLATRMNIPGHVPVLEDLATLVLRLAQILDFSCSGIPMFTMKRSTISSMGSSPQKAVAQIRCVFPALAAVLLTTALLSGCGEEKKAEAAAPDVEVVQVVQRDVPITRQWVATLNGKVNAQIRAQVAGYLMSQSYQNGAYVKKGTPLFQLDPRTFQAAVDQAKGVLAQAKGDLARAVAQQGKTQQDVTRYTPLAAQGAISKQELDDATQNNLSALAQMEAAKAAIASAQASLDAAKLNLGFTTITAPIDGVAGIANAQVGDFISPQSANPLTTISAVNPILVNFTPSEQDYLRAKREMLRADETEEHGLGRLVWELQLTDGTIYPLKGKFYALDRQVDISTGAILMQIEFPNPNNFLRPGGFGNIRTVARIDKNALLVPQRAVSDVQSKFLVAVVGNDNKVAIRPVVVGEKTGSEWIISDGLKPGDRVVAEGIQKVKDGQQVNPKPYQSSSTAAVESNKGTAN